MSIAKTERTITETGIVDAYWPNGEPVKKPVIQGSQLKTTSFTTEIASSKDINDMAEKILKTAISYVDDNIAVNTVGPNEIHSIVSEAMSNYTPPPPSELYPGIIINSPNIDSGTINSSTINSSTITGSTSLLPDPYNMHSCEFKTCGTNLTFNIPDYNGDPTCGYMMNLNNSNGQITFDSKNIHVGYEGSLAVGEFPNGGNYVWGKGSLGVGDDPKTCGDNITVLGYHAAGFSERTFVWTGSQTTINQNPITCGYAPNHYTDHGAGTFSINPENGVDGVFIGETSLRNIIEGVINKTL